MAKERLAETLDSLTALIAPVLEREGFELVDLLYRTGEQSAQLVITVDRAERTSYMSAPQRDAEGTLMASDGVTITDCTHISRMLSPLLDVEDAIDSAYTLEVSSPGVDRPLKKPHHFEAATGLKIRVKTRVPVSGDSFFIATLVKTTDDGIVLDVRSAPVEIPFRLISTANLEFEF